MRQDIHILLVDDEPLVLRSLEKSLLRAGFDVETADDFSTGLALFQAARTSDRPFHIAILDLNVPDLSGRKSPDTGLELVGKLRELDADLPIIVLTAYDEVARAKEAVARGARAYFVKGREAGLVELVKSILSS